jgi:hypothetical protein
MHQFIAGMIPFMQSFFWGELLLCWKAHRSYFAWLVLPKAQMGKEKGSEPAAAPITFFRGARTIDQRVNGSTGHDFILQQLPSRCLDRVRGFLTWPEYFSHVGPYFLPLPFVAKIAYLKSVRHIVQSFDVLGGIDERMTKKLFMRVLPRK